MLPVVMLGPEMAKITDRNFCVPDRGFSHGYVPDRGFSHG
jgi:hypothetical protein